MGSLTDRTFDIGASGHEIDIVLVWKTGSTDDGDLSFSLKDTDLTSAEKAALRLHVCNRAYDFSAAMSVSEHSYSWTNGDLDWSSLSSRTLYLSLPANNAATGTPTITAPDTDPTTVGTTLTATTGDIADTDGLPGTFTYQWSRVDADGTSNKEDISGAMASTYILTAADVGKKVTVALTFTDNLGSEETRTSAVYPASSTIVTAVTTTGALVSNIGQSVHTSSATLGTSQDLHQAFTTGTGGATLTSIAIKLGATVDDQALPVVTLHSGSATSAAIATLSTTGNAFSFDANYTYTAPANTMLTASTTYYVVLEGGGTLFARTTGSNEDSGGQTGWSIANSSGYRTGSSTGAFTNSSSVLMIRVNGTVTTAPGAPTSFTATAGDGEVTLSWAAPASDGGAAITEYEYRHAAGATVPPSTLWTDVADGGDDGNSTADETGVTILSLTNGTEYAFEVRAVNSAGDGTAAGSVTATPAAACAAPSFDTRRNIWTGSLTVGMTSAVSSGFDSDGGSLDDKTFTISSNNYEIDSVFILTAGPSAGYIRFSLKDSDLTSAETAALRLHVCNEDYNFSAAVLTNITHSYTFSADLDWSGISSRTLYLSLPANNAATGTPTISGTATVGQMLTAVTTALADTDGLPTTFTYQWVRVDGLTETDITGATSSTYTLAAADQGKKVKVKVSFTDDLNGMETRTSDAYPATSTVAAALPTVTVAAGGEVDEGDDAEFTLTLSAAAPTGGQSVSYNLALTNPNPVADRAHVAAADLGAKTATVAAGETTATVTVATVDVDDLVSKNSTLTLSLTAGSGYTLGSTAAAEVTIDDTTTATVTYSGGACSATVGEADGRVNLGIQLDKDVAFQISVLLINIPASAATGNDYVAADADGALVFPALTRTKNFQIGIVDNEELEGDEVFDIQLFRNGLDAAVIINTGCSNNHQLTITITDDDTAALSISAPTPVTEGDDIRVTVAPPTGSCLIPFPVTVTLTPSGDTNGLGSADAKSLRLPRCTSGTADFATADDSVKTAARNLLFTLSLPDGTASSITLPATPSAAVTVTDDETLKVTGVAVTSTPSSGSTYGAGETLSFTATFNGPVTVTGTPQLPFSLGGVTKQAAYASGSDSAELVFSYTVAAGDNDTDGVSWAADALALNGGTIKFMTSIVANRVDAALTHAAKTARSGHKVDTPPVLSTRTVNGAALVLTYNEALDTGSEPAGSAFTVKVGGTAVSLATSGAVAVAGRTLTLTLAAAVAAADTVTVSYAVPGSNPLQDAGGTDAPAFADLAVTNGTGNTAPAFANDTAARSFTETVGDAAVTAAGNVGAVVTATDVDADTLTYSLEGADAAKFGIVSGSGQIQTKAGEKYDRETKASYSVTVKADDSNGGTDTVAVTITLANAVEIPLAPGMPAVSATSGSTTSLDVSWTAPVNTGRPALSGYKLQYRTGGGAWTAHAHSGTGTTATIASLTASTAYEVQVRAVNADGDGAWSASGSGTTGSPSNNAPEFSGTTAARSFTETVGDATEAAARDVGAVVTATDADGDTLTYSLEGADAAKFGIVSTSGQIQTRAGERYDREAKASYSVTVKADDSNGGTDTVAVTITLANAVEIPLAPVAPTVAATSGITTSLDVRWTAPGNAGRPAITGYKLQYRQGSSGDWTDHAHSGTGTSATIAGLTAATAYEVQVRAVNADGDGAWSASGSGTTGSASNNAPEFSGTTAARSFTETVGDATEAAARDVGAVVTATDADGDTLTYSLEGADAAKFGIVSGSGQIQTKAGEKYDREAKASYAVTGEGRRQQQRDGHRGGDD